VAGTGVTYIVIANSVISDMADVRIVKDEMTLEGMNLEGQEVRVKTEDDIEINAYIIANEQSKANVILLHGMHGMDATSLFNYAKFLHEANYSVICVDMRAHGKSGGDALSFGYLEPLDVMAVISYIKENDDLNDKPIALYGLSMGGSVAINAAAVSEDIHSVIAVSPFESIQAQVRDYMSASGAGDVFIDSFMPAINLVLRTKFDINPKKDSPIAKIQGVDVPILFMHGDMDSQTNYNQSKMLYEACPSQNKELKVIEGCEHLIVDDILSQDSQFYRDIIINWLDNLYA